MSTEGYKLSIDALSINIALYKKDEDGDFIFLDLNKKAEETEGILKVDLYGKKVTEVYPGIVEMGLLDVFYRVFDTAQTEVHEMAYYHDKRISGWRKNTVSKLDANVLMAVFEDMHEKRELEGQVRSLENKNNENTRLKKKTAQLLSEKSKYEALLKNATDAIFIMDYEGALLEYSDKAKYFLGYEESEMHNLSVFDWDKEVKSSNDYKDIVAALSSEPITIERTHTRKDGTTYIASITASKTKAAGNELIYCAVRDVTEERDTQKQLMQQSKLAQMGEMISMIAHQWRQPLSAISSVTIGLRVEAMLKEFDLTHKEEFEQYQASLLEGLENIEELVTTLSSTINDFRNFFRPNKEYEYIELKEPLKKALKILKPSLDSYGITIKKDEIACDKKVKVFFNELIQVLLNILKNSLDNFIEKGTTNPQITITCDSIADDKVALKIYDNGGGIQENILEKIFDPYFSTKDEKNGTGLGLYMSKMIVEQHHHGKLIVENTTDGVCSTIELYAKADQIN